jgi:MOSC domain-containing protein YiiM
MKAGELIGRVIGLARRAVSRNPMEVVQSCLIKPEIGVMGDCKGQRFPLRQVTVLAREDWEAALADVAAMRGMASIELPWTARRANVFVEAVKLPQGEGSVIALGSVLLEVTEETTPCAQMELALPGLREALSPDWRGGVTCKVLSGGLVEIGNRVAVIKHKVNRKAYLPG